MLGGMPPHPDPMQIRRRRLTALALLVVVAAGVLAVLAGGGKSKPERLVVGGGDHAGDYDPLAWNPDKRGELVQRAASGFSDPVWEKSPGGMVATARRTARWRPLVERAAKANGVNPDTLEAIVFLESAGRPDVIAGGGDVQGAAGLTQIVASTATSLLGMHVDLARSRSLTARIASATSASQQRKLERARRRADQRFDPAASLAGEARYIATAKKRFGSEDLAVASYHMGIGNLQNVLGLYKAQGGSAHPTYAQLYFDTTPLRKPRAYALLSGFGDDSSTYLWRVTAAREVMQMSRSDPKKLAHLDALERDAGPGERRLYPDGAPNVKGTAPATQAVVAYIRAGITRLAGGRLRMKSSSGVRIDVARHYASRHQALMFQYLLDRLQAWNLIAWGRSGNTLSIVVGPDAAKVLPSAAQITRDARR